MTSAATNLAVTQSFRPAAPESPASDTGRSYLLIFRENTSSMYPLPERGDLFIGRAEDAHLQLTDPAASRQQARLMVTPGDIRIVDLGSHNGTRVNGEKITLARTLVSGDEIQIGGVLLVLHQGRSATSTRAIAEPSQLRPRMEEDIARALRYHYPLHILCIDLGELFDRPRVVGALDEKLRVLDFAAWGSGQELWLLLPDLPIEGLSEVAQRLLDALRLIAPAVRSGHAACPSDGCDVDTLLTSARRAARAAGPATLRLCSELPFTRAIAGREAIVAEPAMIRLYDLIDRLAPGELPVLIRGETGAGKDLFAQALHEGSPRKDHRMLALNCATFQDNLLESELFGHERGSFSGAVATKVGLLESAHLGTVFLDEVAELSASAQAKLLRVLENKRLMRVGATTERPVDIRLVAATHRDLQAEVEAGRFRKDLYYRLSGATVVLPPLRERRRELPLLAQNFLRAERTRLSRPPLRLSGAVMERLLNYPWPGNVRELRSRMEYLAITVTDPVAEEWHLPPELGGPSLTDPLPPQLPATSSLSSIEHTQPPTFPSSTQLGDFMPLEEEINKLRRTRIGQALDVTDGNRARAAELLGIPERTLYARLKEYELPTKDPAPTNLPPSAPSKE